LRARFKGLALLVAGKPALEAASLGDSEPERGVTWNL